ncbi:MAG: hypothetical protein IT385_00825 [Deltaproteobacteria bacterium]|nr:hypothetical protein [Deltaproteobacteria bacterium]
MAERATVARRLLRRYLDPTARWTGADERRLRELLRADGEAAALYNRMVAHHRLLVGGDPATPSGLELRRLASATAELASGVAAPSPTRRWLAWLAPVAALALALALVPGLMRAPVDEGYLGARGLPPSGLPERRAGLGIGAVTADGHEYEAVFAPAHLEDWLRFSYTNERPDLGWLFVFALQPERPEAERLVWIAPTPDEARSLPIAPARFRQLPFEVRLGARHATGPVRFVALFTAAPVTVDAVSAVLASGDAAAVSSDLEALLRRRLSLSPGDVVQTLETRVVPGTGKEAP